MARQLMLHILVEIPGHLISCIPSTSASEMLQQVLAPNAEGPVHCFARPDSRPQKSEPRGRWRKSTNFSSNPSVSPYYVFQEGLGVSESTTDQGRGLIDLGALLSNYVQQISCITENGRAQIICICHKVFEGKGCSFPDMSYASPPSCQA